jgi:serine/threonine protein kinase/Tfp pilus assembly protein PilF
MMPSRGRTPARLSLAPWFDLLEQFEQAWQSKPPPEVTAFLQSRLAPGQGIGPTAYHQLLEELVKIDLEYRWRHVAPGSAPHVPAAPGLPPCPLLEVYVRHCPQFGPAERLSSELIAEEYRVRQRWGDRPDHAEYLNRFPHHAAELSTLLVGVDRELRAEGVAVGALAAVADTPAGGPTDKVDADAGTAPALPPPAGAFSLVPGYDNLAKLAHGGMGIVYRAFDPRLSRHVAIKALAEPYRASTDYRQRFLEEAHITAQLQHPGIPAVHEIGTLPDGSPFLVMKLIKGRDLGHLLEERPDLEHERGRFLAIFEQICQAVGYAHDRGVLHRDLKPANVMVGAFGEVQVMDWGLAKVQGPGRPQAPPTQEVVANKTHIRDPRSDSSDGETLTGTMLGTPAYLAPEQAAGAVEAIDARADVFGLGAILCVLLTGQPPYVGDSVDMIRRLALRGELDEAYARLERCGAEPGLVALARRCLAAKPSERPAHAGVVAAEMSRLQSQAEERARAAELDRVQAQAEREKALTRVTEERKRRRAQLALAATLLVLVALVSGGAWWAQKQQAEERARAAELDRVQAQAEHEKALTRVTEERKRRKAQLALAAERARQQQAHRVAAETALGQARELQKRALWKQADALLTQAEGQLGPEGDADMLRQLAVARSNLRSLARFDRIRQEKVAVVGVVVDGAVQKVVDQSRMGPQYAEAFQELGLGLLTGEVKELAQRLKGSPVREELIAAVDDWALDEQQPERRARLDQIADAATGEAWRQELLQRRKDRQALLLKAEELKRSGGPPALAIRLARALEENGLDGLPVLEAGSRSHPGDFRLHLERALRYHARIRERSDAAVGAYHAALALQPNCAAVWNNLGDTLLSKEDLDGAVVCYRTALKINPKLATVHNNLGCALRARKDAVGALASFRAALEINPKLAQAHANIGAVRHDRKDLEGAIASLRKALSIDPKLAQAHFNLGIVLTNKKDLEGALGCFRTAIRLDATLVAPYNRLALALQANNDPARAIAYYRTALEVAPNKAETYYYLGNVLKAKGDAKGAIACFRRAVQLDPKFIQAHTKLGAALLEKHDLEGASLSFRTAILFDPKSAEAHTNLGVVLHEKRDPEGAIACFRTAIRIDPKLALAHANLGVVLADMKDLEGAIASLRKAHELVPTNPVFTASLRERERWRELALKLPAIVAGRETPRDARERLELAQFCARFHKRTLAAYQFYRDAFAADAKLAADVQNQYRYHAASCALRAAAGQGDDATNLSREKALELARQARQWLREDLAAYTQVARKANPELRQLIDRRLGQWQKGPDLAVARDPARLAALPDAERKEWARLWQDVAQQREQLAGAK